MNGQKGISMHYLRRLSVSKRFTETEKWSDPWFRKLSPNSKIGYLYLLDRVDNAGVIDLDSELANFQIGMAIDWQSLRAELSDRIEVLPSGKWHLTRFVAFQFGELNPDCKPHAQVIRLSISHEIKGYSKGINTPQDKDTDKDKEMDTEKTKDKSPDQLRLEKLYRRRESTKWSSGEIRAWRMAKELVSTATAEEWEILEWWFSLSDSQAPYRRTDMASLLNNWHAEIQKARKNKSPSSAPVRFQT